MAICRQPRRRRGGGDPGRSPRTSAARARPASRRCSRRARRQCAAAVRDGHGELPDLPGHRRGRCARDAATIVGERHDVATLDDPNTSPPSPMRADIVAAVAKAVHANYPGVPIVPDMAPYATDGAVFRGAGIPTYGVGSVFIRPADELHTGSTTCSGRCVLRGSRPLVRASQDAGWREIAPSGILRATVCRCAVRSAREVLRASLSQGSPRGPSCRLIEVCISRLDFIQTRH